MLQIFWRTLKTSVVTTFDKIMSKSVGKCQIYPKTKTDFTSLWRGWKMHFSCTFSIVPGWMGWMQALPGTRYRTLPGFYFYYSYPTSQLRGDLSQHLMDVFFKKKSWTHTGYWITFQMLKIYNGRLSLDSKKWYGHVPFNATLDLYINIWTV